MAEAKKPVNEMHYEVLPERLPTPQQLNEEQSRVAADLVTTRGTLRGPFMAAIRSPKLADCLQKLGAYIRFECGLDLRLSRLASLMVARHWTSQYEWNGAVPYALKAGLDASVIDAIAEGRRPSRMAEDEEIIYEFLSELLNNKGVSDATYERALVKFGETLIVDLLGVVGYYSMQAVMMTVSRTPVPGGKPLPLTGLPQQLRPKA